MKRVGIDIGGTKIECAVLDGDGHVLARERVPTERDNGYKHILGQISKLYKKLSDQLSDEFLFGVCVPGPLTAEGDRLKHGNTQALVGEPLKDDIESIFGATPVLDNDANCFAQAEASLGAGKGSKVVFGVILGTGVGGGHFHRWPCLPRKTVYRWRMGTLPPLSWRATVLLWKVGVRRTVPLRPGAGKTLPRNDR